MSVSLGFDPNNPFLAASPSKKRLSSALRKYLMSNLQEINWVGS